MLGIIKANAGDFLAAILLGDDIVQNLIRIGRAREADGHRSDADVLGNSLKPAMDSLNSRCRRRSNDAIKQCFRHGCYRVCAHWNRRVQ